MSMNESKLQILNSTTMVFHRAKSESPASSLSSATHVPTAAHVTSSQQNTSNQPQQTTNTTYGFQLRDDQGREILIQFLKFSAEF